MIGVEILTSAQVATEFAFNWTVFWIVWGIICAICTIMGIYYVITGQCEWPAIPVLFIVGAIIGTAGGYGLGYVGGIPVTYENLYKVTISEEVSMTEFLEHYEVIEQDGKIFTVREKTNESN